MGEYVSQVNWFPGHMAKALRQLRERLNSVQFVLEVRDARLPFSSANVDIDDVIRTKKRLVLLNKADLISAQQRSLIEYRFRKSGTPMLFTNALDTKSLRKVIPEMRKAATRRFKTVPSMAMVVGFPNVGKSSVINALRRLAAKDTGGARRGGAAKTGGDPGVTRHLKGFTVSRDPYVFLIDSPGIMAKSFPTAEARESGLRLAIAGCIKDHLIGVEDLVTVLLSDLNQPENQHEYTRALSLDAPAYNLEELYRAVVQAEGLARGGAAVTNDDRNRIATRVLQMFRKGQLGTVVLDALDT